MQGVGLTDWVMQLAEPALQATTAEAASDRFFAAASAHGATYLQTRLYRRPADRLTSGTHWAAGGLVKRIAPDAWPGSAAFKYICFDCNPLLGAIRENRTRYRFSDFAPRGLREFGTYWEALGEARIADALCATSYAGDGVIASLHLGFDTPDIDPDLARAVQMAGLMLTEHLTEFAQAGAAPSPSLSARERDCLAYIADGLRDREIATRLGITEATVRFHVDNARRKLDATNRMQAIARLGYLRQL